MQTQTHHIFALFGAREPDKLGAAVECAFDGGSYKVASGQWLVRSDTMQPAAANPVPAVSNCYPAKRQENSIA